MSYLSIIEKVSKGASPNHIILNNIYRGLPKLIDEELKGTVRFAKVYGSVNPFIIKDSDMLFESSVSHANNTFTVNKIPEEFSNGSILTLDNKEFAKVDSFDRYTNEIILTENPKTTYSEGDDLNFWASPIELVSRATASFVVENSSFDRSYETGEPVPFTSTDMCIIGSFRVKILESVVVNNETITPYENGDTVLQTAEKIAKVFNSLDRFKSIYSIKSERNYINVTEKYGIQAQIPISVSLITSSLITLELSSSRQDKYGVKFYPKGSKTLIVKSKRIKQDVKESIFLENMDVFAYEQTKGLLGSVTQVTSTITNFAGFDPNSKEVDHTSDTVIYEGDKFYELNLDVPIKRNLRVDDDFFIRAFPSFRSESVKIPLTQKYTSIGPFLVDYLNGETFGNKKINSFLNIAKLDSNGSKENFHPDQDYLTMGENEIVEEMVVPNRTLLFWRNVYGKSTISKSRYIGIATDGIFTITKDLSPSLKKIDWNIKVNSNSDGKISVDLHNGHLFVIDLKSTVNGVLNIVSDKEVKKITISFKTDTKGSKIAISDFKSKLEVNSLRYSFLSHVDGLNRWQGAGIQVKPLFENLDSVNELIGNNIRISNGFLLI